MDWEQSSFKNLKNSLYRHFLKKGPLDSESLLDENLSLSHFFQWISVLHLGPHPPPPGGVVIFVMRGVMREGERSP